MVASAHVHNIVIVVPLGYTKNNKISSKTSFLVYWEILATLEKYLEGGMCDSDFDIVNVWLKLSGMDDRVNTSEIMVALEVNGMADGDFGCEGSYRI